MRQGSGRGSSESDALQAYLRAIARIPRLTVEEERELGRRIREDQDQDALRRLVEGNLRFVVSYTKRYRGLGVSFLDLIHEGNLGLMEAARRFDPERNVKFITYAVWWIRQALTHALSTQTRAFSLPQKVSGAAARFTREVAELTEQLERTADVERNRRRYRDVGSGRRHADAARASRRVAERSARRRR